MPVELENTVYFQDLEEGYAVVEQENNPGKDKEFVSEIQSRDSYRNFVFDYDLTENSKVISLEEDKIYDSDGSYLTTPYNLKFTLDYIGGVVGYDTFWGFQGLTTVLFSDLLGNHRFALGMDINQSISNSDIQLIYSYLPLRPDFTLMAFHFADFYQSYYDIVRLRYYGVGAQTSYPFDRFFRLNVGLNTVFVQEDLYNYYEPGSSESLNTLVPSLGLTSDNTINRFFGPADGTRWNIDFSFSPGTGNNAPDFKTITADFRKYFSFGKEYSLTFRTAGGYSFGDNPQRFILGGIGNWLNYKFDNNLPDWELKDFIFSSMITPLRGSNYYEQYGNQYFLSNIELKFPAIDYLAMRLPIPMNLQYIRGALFMDTGSSWEDEPDLMTGVGYGLRIYLGFALLRIDSAWRTDFNEFSKPMYYFSLGSDF